MKVQCPYCNNVQDYTPKAATARRRPYCRNPTCLKRFTAKAIVRSATAGQKSSDQAAHGQSPAVLDHETDHSSAAQGGDPAAFISKLDPRDQQLIRLVEQGVLLPGLVSVLGITRQSISARMVKLERAGIIVQMGTRPRSWVVNNSFKQTRAATPPVMDSTGDGWYIQTHNLRVKVLVKGHRAEYEKFRASCTDETKLRNWVKKHFHVNDVNFELNPSSIVFHTTGIGDNAVDSLDNARDKGVLIRDHLQTKFNLKLGFPEYIETQVHYIPIKTSRGNYMILRDLWSDASHKHMLETDIPAIADGLKRVAEGVQTPQVTTEPDPSIMKEIQALKAEQAQLVQSVSALVQTLQALVHGGGAAADPRPPPGGMTI